MNTAGTLTCSFPGYQLSKINNLSSIVVLLKIAKHILPFAAGDYSRIYGVFELQGLPAFREYLTKLIYQLSISPCSEAGWRWPTTAGSTRAACPTPRSSTRRRRPLRSPSSTRDGPVTASKKDPRVFSQTKYNEQWEASVLQ